MSPAQVIRDPYIFEFLGLHPHEALSELNLEGQLIDRLQEFLLELGRGFCFAPGRNASLSVGSIFCRPCLLSLDPEMPRPDRVEGRYILP